MRILEPCEGQTGAVTRSKFILSKVLKENGAFDEAEELVQQVRKNMTTLGDWVDDLNFTEEYFERYVLYCHR